MTKQILPNELAEIVTGLLIKPELLGELDSREAHQAFMLDIGRVIADHCGGRVNGITDGDVAKPYLSDIECTVTNGAIVIHTQRLKSDPGGNLLS